MPPKRKSTDGEASTTSSAAKRTRTSTNTPEFQPDTAAAARVDEILAAPTTFPLPADPAAFRADILTLAHYARALESRARPSALLAALDGAAAQKPEKTAEQLQAAVERVRKAAVAGIKKQMVWRPTCKQSRAKYSYDGVCVDPAVFGVLLGLDGPPTFKQKRMSVREFQDHLGDISSSARYSYLRLTGENVTIRWSETGEFKFSGTYGV